MQLGFDTAGKQLFKKKFDGVWEMKDGLMLACDGKKYGYIDKYGNTVIPFVFDMANSMSEGMAWVSINGEYRILIK